MYIVWQTIDIISKIMWNLFQYLLSYIYMWGFLLWELLGKESTFGHFLCALLCLHCPFAPKALWLIALNSFQNLFYHDQNSDFKLIKFLEGLKPKLVHYTENIFNRKNHGLPSSTVGRHTRIKKSNNILSLSIFIFIYCSTMINFLPKRTVHPLL